MVQVGSILLLFSRKAGKDSPKISLCVSMVLGFFLIWQSCPSTLKLLPFLYYLKTSQIATLKSNAKLLIFFFLVVVIVVIPSHLFYWCFGFFSKGKN